MSNISQERTHVFVSVTTVERLHTDLLADYKKVRPVSDWTQTVDVQVAFVLYRVVSLVRKPLSRGDIGKITSDKVYPLHLHGDIIKWKHFTHYWSFVREIQRLLLDSPHKYQCHGALMISLMWAWPNGRENNLNAGDLKHHGALCDGIIMCVSVMSNDDNKTTAYKDRMYIFCVWFIFPRTARIKCYIHRVI